MNRPKIICAKCGRDLTTTTNSEAYRVKLCSEDIPSECGVVTDMAAYPDYARPVHFCDEYCLRGWLGPLPLGDGRINREQCPPLPTTQRITAEDTLRSAFQIDVMLGYANREGRP